MCWMSWDSQPTGRANLPEWWEAASWITLSSVGWITSKLPMVKNVLNHILHAYAQTGAKVLDALGYAKPQGRLQDKLL